MANVMGATYPDGFAAVGVGSGCEYDGQPCVGAPGPAATQTGQEAYQAMGSLVHGMNHAWSGGRNTHQYADPSGPDETAAMYAFFSSHPLP